MNSLRLFHRMVIFCLVCLVPFAGLSGEEPAINVTVFATTMLQDCPLQILDLKPPERVGEPPRVHLRNVSDKQTVRFWIEAQIMTPEGGLNRLNSNTPNIFYPSERVIAPGGEVDALEDVFRSTDLAWTAKGLHSNCLRVAVVVLSVDFSDGTSWHPDFRKPSLRTDLPASELGTCTPSASTEAELNDTQGTGFVPGKSPTQKDPAGVQSYSFSCPLRRKDGEVRAICNL